MSLILDDLNSYLALRYTEGAKLTDLKIAHFAKNFEDYQDLQIQSACLDRYLGFGIESIEKALVNEAKSLAPDSHIEGWSEALHGAQTWVGLSPSQLQTPYFELIEILDKLSPDQKTIIDLGAAYGRLGVLIGLFYPQLKFLGIELVKERVNEAQRIFSHYNFANAQMLVSDTTEKVPKGDVYFVYDFGSHHEILELINIFSEKADRGEKFQIIARGSAINSLIIRHAPWLIKSKEDFFASSLYDC